MDLETILLISDESEAEDSTSNRRPAEETDPLEGKRNLRFRKKPKVILCNSNLQIFLN